MSAINVLDMEQGSVDWLSLRTTKITSTDAAIIMGVNHWKTKVQLYNEKLSPHVMPFVNENMKRGKDLEPLALSLFCIENRIEMYPKVVIKDWAMSSLDGMSECNQYIVEIKCPREKNHALALSGKVPDINYPQLQHHLYVTGLPEIFYYSFDGIEGKTLIVKRDEEYIKKMIVEEKKFYDCIINKTPPEASESDYIERSDDLWTQCASEWHEINEQIKQLEKKEEEIRKNLIFLSFDQNTKGGGISLCKVERKGSVDYATIPQLKGVDLDKHRKPSSSSWRITPQ